MQYSVRQNEIFVVNSQQRGDVVSDGGHCGIAIDNSTTVIGAGRRTVNTGHRFYENGRPTIQRYNERYKEE